MQPTKTDYEVLGDLGGDKIGMTVNQDSLAHIMSVLTNLYENPLLAIIREYSTNAWDSHVAAGQTRPIEVTTPNYLASTLKIKDYGVGMDKDDIRNIYSQYGASTKRGTNEQTGMLGLGCKSALTYTGQFNIIAVKAGIKTSVVVSRSEDGSGVMEIVDESPTQDTNGVEIIIPVQKNNVVLAEAEAFFRFWQPGQVLLNGKEPKTIWATAKRVGEFYIIEDKTDYVVMGNVAYPVANSITQNSGWYRERAIALVKMGEVNFTPSRESLQMSHLTKTKLAQLQDGFRAAVVKSIEDQITSAKTYVEAHKLLTRLRNQDTFRNFMSNVTYRGEKYTNSLDSDFYVSLLHTDTPIAYDGGNTSIGMLENITVIHGFPCQKISAVQKRKMVKWLTNEKVDLRNTSILVSNEPSKSKWVSELLTADWKDVKRLKVETPGANVKPTSYDVLINRGHRINVNAIDTKKKTVFGSGAEINSDMDSILALVLNPQTEFILVAKNRFEKFKEQNPKAEHWLDVARSKVLDYMKNAVQNDLNIMSKNMGDIQIIAQWDLSKIDDPAINTLVFNNQGENQYDAERRYNNYRMASYRLGVKDFPEKSYSYNTPGLLSKYPLINRHVSNVHKSHIYAYMNAVYHQGL